MIFLFIAVRLIVPSFLCPRDMESFIDCLKRDRYYSCFMVNKSMVISVKSARYIEEVTFFELHGEHELTHQISFFYIC